MRTLPRFLLAALALCLLLPGARAQGAAEDVPLTREKDGLYADIETTRGVIPVELFFERAPLTVINFVGLAEGTKAASQPPGKPFFDGLTFHRVAPDFVIQGGDPLGNGEGGPGYSFPDEFSPGLRHDKPGALSMANDGPDTNGSQFFITHREVNRLNYLHSVFGQVTAAAGLDVVNRIQVGDRILHVKIRRVGAAAEAFRTDEAAFAAQLQALQAKRRPAPQFPYFVDGTGRLPFYRVAGFNRKLANYERTTGRRLAVRLLPEFEPDPPYQRQGSKVHEIAGALGLPDSGPSVLAVCFAAQNAWNMRVGEALFAPLFGQGGTAEELMASGVLQQRKEELLARAQELTQAGKLKEAADAAIDALILKLDGDGGRN